MTSSATLPTSRRGTKRTTRPAKPHSLRLTRPISPISFITLALVAKLTKAANDSAPKGQNSTAQGNALGSTQPTNAAL